MSAAEKIIDKRRNKIIKTRLNVLKEMAHPNTEYDKKHDFIESSIERDFFYFKTDDFMGGFQEIRRQLYRVNQNLEKRRKKFAH